MEGAISSAVPLFSFFGDLGEGRGGRRKEREEAN